MKKVLKIIFNIIKWCILLLFIIYIGVLVVQKVSDNKASLGGYRIFTVISGSMVPKYAVGDIVVVKQKPIAEIAIGDDLCYLGKEGDFKDKIVTHSVVKINKKDDDTTTFITEGIANVLSDPEVNQNQVYGVVVYKVITLSFLRKCLSNKFIFFLVIFVPIFGYIIFRIIKVINEVTKEDSEDGNEDEEE